MIGSKNLSFSDNRKFSPQLQLISSFESTNFDFPVFCKCQEISKNGKEIIWLLMVSPRKPGSGELLEYLSLEIQLIISVFWLWHLKISAKSEKWSKSVKNDTKDGIMWVWDELWPKSQQLALNKKQFEQFFLT